MLGLDRRLQFVMGKGGVGRSVVAAAIASRAARRGRRVLHVQVNVADRIAELLDLPPADEEVAEAEPGLFTVNIRPQAAMKEYVLMQVKLELIWRLVFENKAVRYFLRAVPALNDLVVLGKIYYHVGQTDAHGAALYDRVIVDAPATGHGMQLLDLPRVMLAAVQSGPVHREAAAMHAMLHDAETTAVHLVTIPEEMPTAETIETYGALRFRHGFPLGALFVNHRLPDRFSGPVGAALDRVTARLDDDPALAALAAEARRERAWSRLHQRFRARLAEEIDLPAVDLPHLFVERLDRAALQAMVQRIDDAVRESADVA